LNPITSERTLVVSGLQNIALRDIDVGEDGSVYLSYAEDFGQGSYRLARIDPASNSLSLVSVGAKFNVFPGVAIGRKAIFTAESRFTNVERIDAEVYGINTLQGSRTRLASGPALRNIQVLDIDVSPPQVDYSDLSLKWSSTPGQQGVELRYKVEGVSPHIAKKTTIAVYWAWGTTYETRIGRARFTEDIGNTADVNGLHAPVFIPASKFGVPPFRAKYLIAVADPKNLVPEKHEDNNVASWESNLASRAWWHLHEGDYPDSSDTEQLDNDNGFRDNVNAFLAALGSSVSRTGVSTRRPPQRQELMQLLSGRS
jgi:hypothetical protein